MKKYRLKKWVKVLSFILAIEIVVLIVVLLIGNKSEDVSIYLDDHLEIVSAGTYSGKFLEDGSDENIQNVMMIEVYNHGKEALQYAQIMIGDRVFELSTLPGDSKCLVLEKNRNSYDKKLSIEDASLSYVVYFKEGLSIQSDSLEIYVNDGVFNVKNISDQDINEVIYIYFKNFSNDSYFGGITYRVKINGIKKGMMSQVMSNHYHVDSSKVLFVTIGN